MATSHAAIPFDLKTTMSSSALRPGTSSATTSWSSCTSNQSRTPCSIGSTRSPDSSCACSFESQQTKVALEVIRHHRLLELYLARTLGLDVDDVHDEADRLEHVLSEELEARIDRALGFPTHDPHGDPIPNAKLEWPNSRERSEATNH